MLSPDHDHGKHNTRVLLSVLGIDRGGWEYLRAQIATHEVDVPPRLTTAYVTVP